MNRRLRGWSVYANLSARRKTKRDSKARRKAEYLATLPKQPLQRLLYRMHPKRVIGYWFSKKGALMALKITGVAFVILGIFTAALFAYYRRELDSLKPSEISKRVQSTVTKYYDRNGVLLWEDKGTGDYKLVVDSKDIATAMKQATVAIEDKDFYKHGGISFTGIIRASINDLLHRGNAQGASTLTQQLVKNVFFANDAASNRLDLSRKVKEAVLAIEVERMYDKDQILSLYLNEVPYGGRRNGVESAAETYFGKPAKDLTTPEAALIAAIPQNPSYYNPYYLDGNADLLRRQHLVLDAMADQDYITKQQAEDAKKVAILDTIKPELSATENIKAPHFVLTVRSELEKQFGQQFVRGGGLTIKTTLDYRLQQMAEQAVTESYNKYVATGRANNADNIAFTAIDAPTGQILAMVGSYDFNNKEYGATNAATALLQPGSSIKLADYSALLKQKDGQNYGAGSILADEDISNIYKSKLSNFDGQFYGNITVRQAFALSRNPPAVKAAYISGIDNVVNLARDMGDHSYCIGEDYGLSAAIGGCRVREVEHVNAYATLARGGVYKQESYLLEVKNAQGTTISQWKDQSKRVLDPQIPYILSDILADPQARSRVFGPNPIGFSVPGVKTSTKTGTTDNGSGKAKDNWMMSYSPRIAAGVWVGRHDGQALSGISTAVPGTVIGTFMSRAHKEVFQQDGSWKPGDWFQQPAGVQKLNVNGHTDLFPSWYQKPKEASGINMTFDKLSKKKATDCTPDNAKISLVVQVVLDPITNQKTYLAPDGYDMNSSDDQHKCDDIKPFVSLSTQQDPLHKGLYHITVNVNSGTFDLQHLDVLADGQSALSQDITSAGTFTADYTFTSSGSKTITATVTDQGYYQASVSKTLTVTIARQGGKNKRLPNEFSLTGQRRQFSP
jgi:membrane peptidoglycan carboxypeptidase